MILKDPSKLTTLDIWAVRYKEQSKGTGEWEVLINDYHVDNAHASPVVIVTFSKAKHLQGQRYCIKRSDITSSPTEMHKSKQGRPIRRYVVPFSKLEGYDTAQEVKDIINNELGWGPI